MFISYIYININVDISHYILFYVMFHDYRRMTNPIKVVFFRDNFVKEKLRKWFLEVFSKHYLEKLGTKKLINAPKFIQHNRIWS